RESLVTYFRHVVPAIESPGDADLAQFAEAAELMEDETRRNGIAVAGRRFRIVRVERITLMGPDGPEPPRPPALDARWPGPAGAGISPPGPPRDHGTTARPGVRARGGRSGGGVAVDGTVLLGGIGELLGELPDVEALLYLAQVVDLRPGLRA